METENNQQGTIVKSNRIETQDRIITNKIEYENGEFKRMNGSSISKKYLNSQNGSLFAELGISVLEMEPETNSWGSND